MLRSLFTVVLLVAVALIAAIFAAQNPGVITLDLGAVELVDARVSVVFVTTFALGWLFGVFCCAFVILRLLHQRRRLRRSLRAAEAEVSGLRSLPMQDAH